MDLYQNLSTSLMDSKLEIYSKCLERTVEAYQFHLDTVERFIEYFKDRIYPLPVDENPVIFKRSRMVLNAWKEPDDPFDTIYNVSFVTKQSQIDATFGKYMRESGIEFDMRSFQNKQLLFKDIAMCMENKIYIRPVVLIKSIKVEFKFRFFLTKTDTLLI